MMQPAAPGTAWNEIRIGFHPRILGTPAPVFPGFEVDLNEPIEDADKPDAVWHRERARALLRAHPEIKQLVGREPSTAVWCLLLASLQVVMAVAVAEAPGWVVVLAAYGVGAMINICLFNLAHDCNHHLIFRKPAWNRWLFTWTSLPMFLSAHHAWWVEHHVHHNDLGSKKDFIKRRRTFFLLTRQPRYFFVITRGLPYLACRLLWSPLIMPYGLMMLVAQVFRSALGLGVYVASSLLRGRLDPGPVALAILADQHLVSAYRKYGIQRWAVVYPALALGLLAVLYGWGGWTPIAYLLLSQLFTTGFLHPVALGLILSNSHFHGHKRYQPSSSYYGWLNKITFNFGLHTEHHDLARIPWSRLPQLRRIAPEFYDDLVQTPSYTGLALQFVFGSQRNLEEQFDNEKQRNREMLAANGS